MEPVQPVNEPSTRWITAKNPKEIRLIIIADAHMASSSPPSWKADYKAVVEATVEQVLQFAIKVDADVIVWPGDLFHRKSPDRNPLWFVADVMRLLKKSGIPNVGVAGNHDLVWGSLKGLPGQPINILIEGGTLQLLDHVEMGIRGEDFTLRIAGASYEHGKADDCRAKKKYGATWLMSVGHFWFGATDGVFNGEPLYSPTFLGQGEPDIYAIGHKHEDQGFLEVEHKTYIVPGSISLTGEKANDHMRRPAASYVRITSDEVITTILRPKVPEVGDLINLEQRAQALEENKAMESFVADISTAKVVGTDPKQIIADLNLAPEVLSKVEFYMELASK